MSSKIETRGRAHTRDDLSSYIDGQGLLRGTHIEAARIAALVHGGMSMAQLRQDYPNLLPDQIDAAVRFGEADVELRRSFPPRTAKSVLRDGGGGGLADAFAAARADEDHG